MIKPDGARDEGILIEDTTGNLSFLVELPIPLPGAPGAFLSSISDSLARLNSTGCSVAQFCGLVNQLPRPQRLARCARSDWRNDEPEKRLPLDCAITRTGGWWWWLRAECAAR